MRYGWVVAAAFSGLYGVTIGSAQVVRDGTLGAGPSNLSNGSTSFQITPRHGAQHGQNLFHSFREFSITSGQTATFTGPPSVKNVLARVTGGTPSTIGGTLGCSVDGANVILMNPAGVLLTAGGRLDVTGSFAVTTADFIALADGGRFVASPGGQDADSLLTTAPPRAFGFLADTSRAKIDVQGTSASTLQVENGSVLSLVGGDVRITSFRLAAVGGRIDLIAAGDAVAEIELDLEQPGAFPGAAATSSGPGGDLIVTNSSANAAEGGGIVVRAGNVLLESAALTVPTDDAAAGDINVYAGSIRLTKGSSISASTFRSGDGGTITLDVTERLEIDAAGPAPTGLFAAVEDGASGNGGSIVVRAGELAILNEGQITTTTFGAGTAGSINIRAGRLLIDGGDAPLQTGVVARVGDPRDLGLSDEGNKPTGNVAAPPVPPLPVAADLASGDGGRIDVAADTVTLRSGGVLSASSFGIGDGGAVRVRADQIELLGSPQSRFTGIFARSTAPAGSDYQPGEAGSISVEAGRTLRMTDGAAISVKSVGADAGDVVVRAGEFIGLSESRPDVPDARVAADLDDDPPPGGPAPLTRITARAVLQNGGNIRLSAPQIHASRSLVTAEAGMTGAAIDVDAQRVVLDASVIAGRSLASAQQDVDVTVIAGTFLPSSDSEIRTSKAVTPVEVDLAGSLAALRGGLRDAGARLAEFCGARAPGSVSTFLVTGRGGIPPEPTGMQHAGQRTDRNRRQP